MVWFILFALGCYHGINPGMGWLFAVALGLQERRTSAVLSAIAPIAIGHIASVAIIVMLALFAVATFPHRIVHVSAGLLLLAFGVYRLSRARHVRWVGMRVGFAGLLLWGFVMSTAHGAGLMLVPFVTAASPAMRSNMTRMPMPAVQATSQAAGWLMIGVHTFGYLLTMTAVALLVYRKFGLSFLRTAWFNIDATWAAALILTGLIALFT